MAHQDSEAELLLLVLVELLDRWRGGWRLPYWVDPVGSDRNDDVFTSSSPRVRLSWWVGLWRNGGCGALRVLSAGITTSAMTGGVSMGGTIRVTKWS